MNKKKIILIGWTADIALLYLSIFLPKNEVIYDITFIVFLITFLVGPLLLLVWGLFACFQEKENQFSFHHLLPMGGFLLLELAGFIKFQQALIEEAMVAWIIVISTAVFIHITVGLLLWRMKYTFRGQAFLTIISLLVHFTFLYFAIQISFIYNNLW